MELSPLKSYLHTIIQLTRTDMEQRFAKAKVKITPLQYAVLAATKAKPVTMNEIAHRFSFKAPSLVPAIDALETAGLLHRKNDPKDRRKIQLLITRKGQELIQRLPQSGKYDALSQAFHALSQSKQKQLLDTLQELITHFPHTA